MNIEKELFPESGKLKIENGIAKATIIDLELDPIECVFMNDDSVQIDTHNYEFLCLDVAKLKELIGMIEDAKKYYDSQPE